LGISNLNIKIDTALLSDEVRPLIESLEKRGELSNFLVKLLNYWVIKVRDAGKEKAVEKEEEVNIDGLSLDPNLVLQLLLDIRQNTVRLERKLNERVVVQSVENFSPNPVIKEKEEAQVKESGSNEDGNNGTEEIVFKSTGVIKPNLAKLRRMKGL